MQIKNKSHILYFKGGIFGSNYHRFNWCNLLILIAFLLNLVLLNPVSLLAESSSISSAKIDKLIELVKKNEQQSPRESILKSKATESEVHPAYEKNSNNKDNENFEEDLILQKQEANKDKDMTTKGLGFFRANNAIDFYSSDIQLRDKPKVQILNSSYKLNEVAEEIANVEDKPRSDKDNKEKEDSVPKDSEEIVSKFGNPEEEPAIIPEDKSPKSYKGLMAALESGDDELAYRYARQFVRYQRNLQERVKKITDFSMYAMEEDGTILKKKRDSEDPEYEAIRAIAEKTKAKWGQDPFTTASNGYSKEYFESTKILDLDDRTKEIIKLAEISEDKNLLLSDKEAEELSQRASLSEFDPAVEEKAIIRDLNSGVPVDPDGKVLVYFFSRPADSEAYLMSQAIESIFQENKDNQKFNLVSLTIDRATKAEITDIKNARRSKVPLRSGGDIAEKLGVKRSPTTVFIAPTTGKAFIAEGLRSYVYLDKIVKHVMGDAYAKK